MIQRPAGERDGGRAKTGQGRPTWLPRYPPATRKALRRVSRQALLRVPRQALRRVPRHPRQPVPSSRQHRRCAPQPAARSTKRAMSRSAAPSRTPCCRGRRWASSCWEAAAERSHAEAAALPECFGRSRKDGTRGGRARGSRSTRCARRDRSPRPVTVHLYFVTYATCHDVFARELHSHWERFAFSNVARSTAPPYWTA